MIRIVSLLALLAGCSAAPTESPKQPADGPGDCESACRNLSKLGGCGVHMPSCVPDCEAAWAAENEVGVTFPRGCLTAAPTCKEAREWR